LVNTKKGKRGKPKVTVKYNLGLTSQQSADYKTLGDKDYMELYWEMHRNTFMHNGYSKENANSLAAPALLAGLSYNPYLMEASELFDSNGKLNPKAINHWADDTDWYGAVTQLGKRHDANVSISGANENTDYYTSVGYMSEEGYMVGSQFERISAKANVNSKITDWLKVGTNISASYSTAEGRQNESSGNNSNPFRVTRYIGNVFPIHIHNPATGEYVYDVNGNKIHDFGSGWESPDGTIVVQGRDAFANTNHALESRTRNNGYLRQTMNIKGYAEASLMKGLKLTINGGLGSNMYRNWSGIYAYEQKGNAGSSSKEISNTNTWTFQQLLNYSKSIGKHNFDILAGHESYQYEYHNMGTSMKTQTIIGDNYEYRNYTEIGSLPTSYTNNYRVEGFLSRLNYDFDEKYFFSASYRRDGSSRFYKDVRWGDFWSVGAGWTIDKEEFMAGVKFVDFLKLRVSYGVVGNDDLSSYYPWRAVYGVNNNGEPGYIQSSLGNKELTWETSNNFDLATEFTLFNGRLEGSLEYFSRMSSDLLFSVKQPISSGVTDIDKNAGSMYNRGVEIALDGLVINKGDFKLGFNGNATLLKNKITELPMEPYITSMYKIEEGHSRYDFWLRQWHSVNPDNGYNLFEPDLELYEFEPEELIEIDGKQYTEVVTKAKYDYSGTGFPTVTGGIGANIGWKNFNLKFTFYYQLGGKFYNSGYKSLMDGSNSYWKQHVDLLGRWREPGDVTDIARVSAGTDVDNIQASTSTRWLISSNMLELANINLSYTIPNKILKPRKISSAVIYFTADNALLFTAKRGMYPRRNFMSGYISNADVYSPSRVISFGLSLTF
ncbi:MAG: SusC/RagA family TonB-linked outer membrane protein, partial [Bacteroidales bacterium]